MELKNRVVFITGSSIGIGKETALKFAKEGCKLIITYYKDKEEAELVSRKCLEIGAPEILVLHLNVMDSKSIKDGIKKIIGKFGQIDFLINNAGIIVWKPFKDLDFDEIESQVRTNLEGPIKVARECLPYVKEAIINVASGAGQHAYGGLSVYCATKFGLRGFTQSFAQELRDVKVFSVNPGMTATRMTNFAGTKPQNVAEIILKAAKGDVKPDRYKDINVYDMA